MANIRIHSMLLIVVLFSAVVHSADNPQESIFYDSNKDVAIAVELFEFDSEQQRQDAVQLAKTLRCPQCQNQNLVESNSPIAKDLRLRVYKMIKAGQSDEEIIQYMTQRFGEFVLYDPAFNHTTYILWFIPVLLLITGVVLAVRAVNRNKASLKS